MTTSETKGPERCPACSSIEVIGDFDPDCGSFFRCEECGHRYGVMTRPIETSGPVDPCPSCANWSAQFARQAEVEAKANSFDAIWELCVELGMEVHPSGADEDGHEIAEEWAYQFGFIRGLKLAKEAAEQRVEILETQRTNLMAALSWTLAKCSLSPIARMDAEGLDKAMATWREAKAGTSHNGRGVSTR